MRTIILTILLIFTHPDDFALLGEYSTTDEVINYYTAVQYLPEDMYDRLVYHGWKLAYIDNIDEVYPHAMGYYNTGLKEVYVDDKKIKKYCSNVDTKIQETIVHEFTHAYDYEQDFPSCMIYNPSGIDSDEVFAYNMTDWLFGKPVDKKYKEFFETLF